MQLSLSDLAIALWLTYLLFGIDVHLNAFINGEDVLIHCVSTHSLSMPSTTMAGPVMSAASMSRGTRTRIA